MNTRDLFELASLDVLGLLDEDERASFEEAFRAAPPQIQAQIRAEQTRFSDVERILPDVEAPMGLRHKVMSGINEAIAAVQAGPVAAIGPGGRVRTSAPIWRAACIGFATASLVLGGFSWKITQDNRAMASIALSNHLSTELAQKAGPGFTDLITRPTLRHVAFSPAAPDAGGKAAAALFVDTATKTAYLVCDSLPVVSGEYRLVLQSATGTNRVATFTASSGNFYVPIERIDVESLKNLSIHAPVREGEDKPLLVTSGV